MNVPDLDKARREQLRWLLLQTLDKGRPIGVHELMMLGVAQAIFADATQTEVRREMDYLEKRELIKIIRDPSGPWRAELLRFGIEIVDYTCDCDPGIARPVKYW